MSSLICFPPAGGAWFPSPGAWSERGLHLVTLMNSVGEVMGAISDQDTKGTVTSS